MGKVVTGASVSLDGYIAGPEETGFEHLFAWYDAGDIEFPSTHPELRFALGPSDHDYLSSYVDRVGALVVGRRLFDLVDGWGGVHPLDRPIVVVTHRRPDAWITAHPQAPFSFVTDGVAAAIDVARHIARDKDVGVNGGTMARQCLELGLLDEIFLDLVPVLLGGGTPFFDHVGIAPVLLDGPTVTEGRRATHLHYAVRRP